jgi:hypothetical protein
MNTFVIPRTQLKNELGLPKVSDITCVRRALGQRDWQNSSLSLEDAIDIRRYYFLVRDEKVAPADALLQIACDRGENSGDIDESAIAQPHEAKRDEDEEKGAAILAVQEATSQGNLGMAETGAQMATANIEALKIGYVTGLVAGMQDFGNAIRSNLNTLAEAAASIDIDLREANLPKAKLNSKVVSGVLEPHQETQSKISKALW